MRTKKAETGPQRLERLRRQQGGAVTRKQVLDCGLTDSQLRTLLRHGEWDSLERGTYVLRQRLLNADPAGQHALRVASRALPLVGDHAASRRSGALVLGLPTLGPEPCPPELARRPRSRSDRSTSPTLRVLDLHDDDVVRWRDVLVCSPARLVCDTARTDNRLLEAVMVADAALRAGLSHQALAATGARCARWSGARSIAQVLERSDGRTESPLETLTRLVLAAFGVPAPLSQVDVFQGSRFLGRVDFAWPDLGLVLESDGMTKYRQDDDRERGQHDPLVKEKKRELGLRRAGIEVLRSTWTDAWSHPEALAALWHEHADFAAGRTLASDVVFQQSELVPTGQNGIPFPSKAARPLPSVPSRGLVVPRLFASPTGGKPPH